MSRDLSCVHEVPLAQRACLPALAPDVIRRAAHDFSTRTAASTDGFSMRHIALLSDDALAFGLSVVHLHGSAWDYPAAAPF